MRIDQLLLIITLLVTQSMSLPPHRLIPGNAHNFEYCIDPGWHSFTQKPAVYSESHSIWSKSLEFAKTSPQLPAHGAIVPDEPKSATGTLFRQISILSITLSVIVSIATSLRSKIGLRGLHSQAKVFTLYASSTHLSNATQLAFKSKEKNS